MSEVELVPDTDLAFGEPQPFEDMPKTWPDGRCRHRQLRCDAALGQMIDDRDEDKPANERRIWGYHVTLRVTCIDCHEPFVFIGIPKLDHARYGGPTVDASGCSAILPVAPTAMAKPTGALMFAWNGKLDN